jgi:DNA-binding transcriptional ArsR family regulator
MQDAIDALAHPGRRALLRLVLDRELPVGELADRAGLSQPAASQHLKVLRDAGLVRQRVDGRRRLYRVDADGLAQLRGELEAFWGPALAALKKSAEGA